MNWLRRRFRLIILFLAAVVLRVLFLNAQPLWWDEGYSVYFSTESLTHLLELTSFDIHPPLYYVLLKGWFTLFGVGVVRARLLSVVLGIAAIPLMWTVVQELWPRRRVTVMSTALLVVSPFHVYYSQEVRMYALLLVCTLAAMLGFLRASRTGDRNWWIVTVGALVAALLTQYYAVFVVAAVAIMWWWLQREKPADLPYLPDRRTAGILFGATALAYLPWALYAGWRLFNYVSSKIVIEGDAPMSPLEFPLRHATVFSVGHLMPQQAWLVSGAILFVALAVLGIWHSWGETRWQAGVALIWLFVPLLGAFIINLIAPFTDARIERQMIIALPPFLIFIALGLDAFVKRAASHKIARQRAWSAIGFAILLLLFDLVSLIGFYSIPRYVENDYRPILSYVEARQGPNDVWLAVYPWQVGYVRAYLPEDKRPAEFFVPQDRLEQWSQDGDVRQAGIDQLYQQYSRIWFPAFQIKGRILERRLVETLHGEGLPVWNGWFGNTRLWLTAHNDTNATTEPDARFGGGLQLSKVEHSTDTEASGIGVVPFLFTWNGAEEENDLRISIQLVGPSDTAWGEYDSEMTTPTTRAGVLIEPGTPPGEYAGRLRVYDGQTGRPRDLLDTNGNPVAPEYNLGTITVTRPPEPLPAAALPARRTFNLPLGQSIRMIGATVATDTVKTGDALPVVLFWQATETVDENYRVFVQALDPNGEIRGARDLAPVDGRFPTTQWQAGDLIRDPHDVLISAGAPAGRYTLIAGLYDPETGTRLPTHRGADHVPLGSFVVEERPHTFEAPAYEQNIGVPFGEEAALVGATIEWPNQPNQIAAGQTLPVRLVWQPQRTPPMELRAFVQLLGDDNQLGGVSDHHPGDAPTRAWVAGEYIIDQHQLAVREDAAGTYRLVVGLYNPDAGRLTTPDASDTLTLTTITIN